MGESTKGRTEQLVGPGLDPVTLARQMLALGVASFQVGDIRVDFADVAVSEAAAARTPLPKPLEAGELKRSKDEQAKAEHEESLKVELWSAG